MALNNTPSLNNIFTNMTVAQLSALANTVGALYAGAGNNTLTTASGVTVSVPTTNSTAQQTTTYYASTQAFQLTATGLKPLTTHTFTFDNVNVSANCKPFGGVQGGPLTSDASGNIVFTFSYSSGLPASTTDTTSTQSMINKLAGTKIGVLQNSDQTSSAIVQINFISQADITTPVVTSPSPYSISTAVDLGINLPGLGGWGVAGLGGYINIDLGGLNNLGAIG